MNIYIIHFIIGVKYSFYEILDKKSIKKHACKVFTTTLISFISTELINYVSYLNFILNIYQQRKIKCKLLSIKNLILFGLYIFILCFYY